MQSKTSFFNGTLFKQNLRRTWPLGLVWFLILFFTTSLQFILQMESLDTSAAYESDYILVSTLSRQNGGVFFSIFVAIIGAMLLFGYLYQKRDAYMMHAFPLSRKTLYFTGLSALAVVMLLPVLLNTACLLLLALLSGAGHLQLIFFAAWIQLGACVIFAGIAMFTLMISGQGIATIIFYFIFNGMFLLMEVAIRLFIGTLMFGLNNFLEDYSLKILSPLVNILDNCCIELNAEWSENGEKLLSFSADMLGGRDIAIYVLVGIFLMGLGYVLYCRKNLETVHEFITVPLMKWIFQICIPFFLSIYMAVFSLIILQEVLPYSYGGYFALAIFLSLFYGVIIFYLAQMLIKRSTRVFEKKTARCCIIYSLAALVVFLTFRFDLWHLESYVPDASQIEWAGIEDSNIQVYTDEENIGKVLELQKGIIADKKEMREMTYSRKPVQYISIRYKLKNGKMICRYYTFEESSEGHSSLYQEVQDRFLALANDPENIKEHILGNIWDDCDVTYLAVEANDEEDNEKAEELSGLGSEEKKAAYRAIYEAVLKDIDEGKMLQESFDTEEKMAGSQLHLVLSNQEISYSSDISKYYGYSTEDMEDQHSVDIYISLNEKATNTIKALKEYGLSINFGLSD